MSAILSRPQGLKTIFVHVTDGFSGQFQHMDVGLQL